MSEPHAEWVPPIGEDVRRKPGRFKNADDSEIGTVIQHANNACPIVVRWALGHIGGYKPGELVPAAAGAESHRFTPGMRVLVKLRHTETGGRGEVRYYEQVRLGTVEGYDAAAGRYAVRVPGWDALWQVRGEDVRDAMEPS